MSTVGQREAETQRRVIRFFQEKLGYKHLGNWKDRDNSNIEDELLTEWLRKQGHEQKIIDKVLFKLNKDADIGAAQTLYESNKNVYSLLRYGAKVQPDVGEHNITVWLIDWNNIENNEFAIAEEVSIVGNHCKRPDIVLYVNGIALGVLELKRSTVSVGQGIRQNLDNQKKDFIQQFFTTTQLIMAGNDTEGLRYGVIETPERNYLEWKEQALDWIPSESKETKYMTPWDDGATTKLECQLGWICSKDRFLEIIHNFIVFDAGTKKVCRHNQYFGVRAGQEHIRKRIGGIIWHTQGSGKSLTMVWLAKWIRENIKDSRVLLITDRTELDEQIEKVFKGVSENIYRTNSGADLVNVLNSNKEWLICSLIHKFRPGEELSEQEIDNYVKDIKDNIPKEFHAKCDIFVFVDECHRTQSGKLHKSMKDLLPDAMLIGFTGTPLLKKDKQKSIEVFGPYIHTYKYDEAVRDGVVLDLRYEARDIDQSISAIDKIDKWFESKTRGLSDLGKAQLKRRWGTIQKLLTSEKRLDKIVVDINYDMVMRDRLMSGHGNALLVSDSIYSACRFYEIFQTTELACKCAIITSYEPNPSDIRGEESGEGLTEKLLKYNIYRQMLAAHFDEDENKAMNKTKEFEQQVKHRFINEPGQIKLLIVVDKLLTGFDAPSATYLYIDKTMRDHGLFQAICRVNRLDGEDKEYGYIIDYKDLFLSLEKSIEEYTGSAFDGYERDEIIGMLKSRVKMGRERLDNLLEKVRALCEPVNPPKDTNDYIHYFCTNDSGNTQQLKDNERKRVVFYKHVASLIRAYADLANEMDKAGYSKSDTENIKSEIRHYEKVREEIQLASGDYVDMKKYEPAMRHLLDKYIRAEESTTISAFDDMSLIQLIIEKEEDAINKLPIGIRKNKKAVAETIENNVRKLLIDESPVNPKYYEKMSDLLDTLIQQRKEESLAYEEYLKKIVELTRKIGGQDFKSSYPHSIKTPGQRALYDNLDYNEELALRVDIAIHKVKKDDWRKTRIKKREVRNAIQRELEGDADLINIIFSIVEEPKSGY